MKLQKNTLLALYSVLEFAADRAPYIDQAQLRRVKAKVRFNWDGPT